MRATPPLLTAAVLLTALFTSVWAEAEHGSPAATEHASRPEGAGADDATPPNEAVPQPPEPPRTCVECHEGLSAIREDGSEMMSQIRERSAALGASGECQFCHGGTSPATSAAAAHRGASEEVPPTTFLPAPASIWIAEQTCGGCHETLVERMLRALMQTEAGKIQGTTWGFGALEGTSHDWGNYDATALEAPVVGTDAYRRYIANLAEALPGVFPEAMTQVPAPDMERLEEDPRQAAFTYIRTECQRCHIGVRGACRRGDWRGTGCAACHVPYSNEGLYEGGDRALREAHGDEPGHVLVHRIQSTREATVALADGEYSGIPVETCTTCHNRGKRIGVSYQGLMETSWRGAPGPDGTTQPALHGKYYLFVEDDRHHRGSGEEGGLLCQDCHTTIDVHGDGHLFGTNLAQVEIECTDCHGTPSSRPWELPLGYGDEFGLELAAGPRGTASEPTEEMRRGTPYDAEDGYVLTARGNPFGNVVRRGDDVVVHSAGGADHVVPNLHGRRARFSEEGRVAMVQVERHLERLECSACHTRWAPQCYGCHVTVDYSDESRHVDWIAAGSRRDAAGRTADMGPADQRPMVAGRVHEERSYLRWDSPPLAVNGEGRVSPVIPGCQTTTTVIAPDGRNLVHSKIWRGPPNVEGGGAEGQRGLDMSPTTPHTVTKRARPCVSCHADPRALGYGIAGGEYQRRNAEAVRVDLADAQHRSLTRHGRPQLQPVHDLPFDWSRFVTEDGEQLQTVGHHLPLSAPLSQETRERMSRVGACLACHADIPDGSPFIRAITLGSSVVRPIETDDDHSWVLRHVLNTSAVLEILVPPGILAILVFGVFTFLRRRRRKAEEERAGDSRPRSSVAPGAGER